MLHTHTPRVAGFDFFWKNIAANVGKIIQIQKAFGANVQSRVQLLRMEVRISLKCLDRVTEAHVFNHPPRVVDFPRRHSSRQSG